MWSGLTRWVGTEQVHSLVATVFPKGSGLFQQDNLPCHTANSVQEYFGKHSQNMTMDKQVQFIEVPPCDFKDLLLM